jgi:DNA-binding transcriptional LysR family regulator
MPLKRTEVYELSIFLAIVQHRSFRKAADHLDVTASALSHSMRALETRLGVRLLNRTSRSVAPTAAGKALAEKISAGP